MRYNLCTVGFRARVRKCLRADLLIDLNPGLPIYVSNTPVRNVTQIPDRCVMRMVFCFTPSALLYTTKNSLKFFYH